MLIICNLTHEYKLTAINIIWLRDKPHANDNWTDDGGDDNDRHKAANQMQLMKKFIPTAADE